MSQVRLVPANRIADAEAPDDKLIKKGADFVSYSGIKVGKPLEEYGKAYLTRPSASAGNEADGIFGRVSRFFPNQEAFLNAVGLAEKRFWVDGVVYVKGPLTIPDFHETDIRGGVVLVDGPLVLGEISRGIRHPTPSKLWRKVKSIKPAEILTFVSLSGETIELKGERHIGIQLVSLPPGLHAPKNLVAWEPQADFTFVGGLAVSTFDLKDLSKNLSVINEVLYAPQMAAKDPEFAVSFTPVPEAYSFHRAP